MGGSCLSKASTGNRDISSDSLASVSQPSAGAGKEGVGEGGASMDYEVVFLSCMCYLNQLPLCWSLWEMAGESCQPADCRSFDASYPTNPWPAGPCPSSIDLHDPAQRRCVGEFP